MMQQEPSAGFFFPLLVSVLIWTDEGRSVSPSPILWSAAQPDLCPVPPELFLLACARHVPSDWNQLYRGSGLPSNT